MWCIEDNVLYDPDSKMVWKPPVDYEDFHIDKNHVWYINMFKGRPVVLYCHGNNANISYREYVFNLCKHFKFNLCMFDYRGYGKSSGRPSQQNICFDGEKVYKWLLNKYEPNDIIVWGESLGGAVAIHIASKHECRCLIVFSSFSSIDEIITHSNQYNWFVKQLAVIASWILNTLPSKRKIGKVKSPVLIVHSDEDDVIPISNAKKLYKKVKHDKKKFLSIKGKHIEPLMNPEQFKELCDFCHNPPNCCNKYEANYYFMNHFEDFVEDMKKGSEKCRDLCHK